MALQHHHDTAAPAPIRVSLGMHGPERIRGAADAPLTPCRAHTGLSARTVTQTVPVTATGQRTSTFCFELPCSVCTQGMS